MGFSIFCLRYKIICMLFIDKCLVIFPLQAEILPL